MTRVPLYPDRPIRDEVDRVLGPDRLQRPPRRYRKGAGEWDWLQRLTRRQRRRLAGGGWLSGAYAPDQLAQLIDPELSVDDAMGWYVRHALAVMDERRAAYPPWVRARYAQLHGFPSYYALRVARARAAGFRSLWDMRQAVGWDPLR